MQYFKNVQLAELHGISEKSVRNWIEAAREGRLDLALYEHDGKHNIANTTKNKLMIEELVERGRKSRNTRYHSKVVTPSPEFYKLYTPAQIWDIVTNLDDYREIPLMYSYFNDGADLWDQYVQKLDREPNLNLLQATRMLMDLNAGYLDHLNGDSRRVNIVDLGIGNAMPTKGLLTHVLDNGTLGRYIGIDESEAMLKIAERNLKEWFGNRVSLESYVRDIKSDKLNDLLIDEYFNHASDNPISYFLSFGGTIMNFREPTEALSVIRQSMRRNDLLIHVDKLDTQSSRHYFDFGIKEDKIEALSPRHRLMLDLLNIDQSCYEVEQIFDEQRRTRYIRIRLKVAISIRFELNKGQYTVGIDKGDTILIWRALDVTSSELVSQFETAGLRVLHTSTTKDLEYFMIVGGIE